MPIYAYRCAACGHAKDVLQKISDPVLNVCPACGASSFKKQVTAAGFQLKGSGWYVTDFRGGSTAAAASTGDSASGDGSAGKTESGNTDATAAPAAVPAAGTEKPAAPAAPASAKPASGGQ